jgi:hypothetical protein
VRELRFSFVHRRFAEFFVVRKLQRDNTLPALHTIPTDSRWRDCLSVYCGIAPEVHAREIAHYCWEVIRNNVAFLRASELDNAKPAIHCLRFLTDSFQSRINCLSEFQKSFSATVVSLLAQPDPLVAKIAAEAISILDTDSRPEAVGLAFSQGSSWLTETALRSCRHLAGLGEEVPRSIRQYVRTLHSFDLIRSSADLSFSFGLSDALKSQRIKLWLDLCSLVVLWLTTAVFLIIAPLLTMGAISMALLMDLSWPHGPNRPLDERSSVEGGRGSVGLTFAQLLRQFIRPGLDSMLRMTMLGVVFYTWSKWRIGRLSFGINMTYSVWLCVFLILIPWELWTYMPQGIFALRHWSVWRHLLDFLVCLLLSTP